MHVKFMIMGRSYDQAAALPDHISVETDAGVTDAIDQVGQMLPAGHALPESGLVVVSGKHLGTVARHENEPLRDGDELVIIAPVAGG